MGEQVFRIGGFQSYWELFTKVLDATLLTVVGISCFRRMESFWPWLGVLLIICALVLVAFTTRDVSRMVRERIVMSDDSVRMLYGKRVLFEARYEDFVSLYASHLHLGNDYGGWTAHTCDHKVLMFDRRYAKSDGLAVELEERTGLKFNVDLVQSPSRSVKA